MVVIKARKFTRREDLLSIARRLPLQELAVHLTQWIEPLSPTRAAIVTEQLRGLVQEDHRDEYVLFGAGDERVAALVLLHQQGQRFISIVHAGFVDARTTGAFSDPLLVSLRNCLRDYCDERQLPFMQWSTEPCEVPKEHEKGSPAANQPKEAAGVLTPEQLGFTWLGTLDFLALDFPTSLEGSRPPLAPASSVRLQPVGPEEGPLRRQLEDVIASTYQDSLDCPRLEEFRTPAEIIDTYRHSAAYRPDWWFLVQRSSADGRDVNVGALILAEHQTRGQDNRSSTAIELVYMGVVPEYRGGEVGRQIMTRVLQTCRAELAARLILAVDRSNHYAAELYRSYGMKRLVSESIWGRRFGPPNGVKEL